MAPDQPFCSKSHIQTNSRSKPVHAPNQFTLQTSSRSKPVHAPKLEQLVVLNSSCLNSKETKIKKEKKERKKKIKNKTEIK